MEISKFLKMHLMKKIRATLLHIACLQQNKIPPIQYRLK